MPIPKGWNPYDSALVDDVSWEQAKMRMNKKPRAASRIPTGMASLDEMFGGGIPEGLMVAYGAPGAGKSMFSKSIATSFVRRGKRVLYLVGEDLFDAIPAQPPLVNTADFLSYRPGPEKAVKTILKYIQHLTPDLVVIDSLTTILGGTTKAVPEADIREYTGELASRLSGIIPAIGISEIRGSGYSEGPAGGKGVLHAGLAVTRFDKKVIETKWEAGDWGSRIGDVVWYALVEKDRDGLACQGRLHRVVYVGDEMVVSPLGG